MFAEQILGKDNDFCMAATGMPYFLPSPNCLYTSQVAGWVETEAGSCAVPLKSGEAHQSVILRIFPTDINSFLTRELPLGGCRAIPAWGMGRCRQKWGCLLFPLCEAIPVFVFVVVFLFCSTVLVKFLRGLLEVSPELFYSRIAVLTVDLCWGMEAGVSLLSFW